MIKTLKVIGNYIIHADLYLLILALISSMYGVVLIYSATYAYDSNKYVLVQLLAIAIGIVAFIIVSLIDIDNIADIWKFVFVLNLILLGSLYFFGTSGDTGNKSWIRFGSLGIQPAEIGKILFIFTFAKHVSSLRDNISHIKSIFVLLLHIGIVCGFILFFSGDAGMALVYVAIAVIILFVAGISYKWIVGAIILAISAVPVVWNFVLQEYQKLRILVIFDPTLDPDKSYQATQSKIAIGAGQFYGSGYLQGKQTQYGMLPAKHTDFIFSVAAEELGFIGAMAIVGLLFLLILRLFYVSTKASTSFSSLVCIGVAAMFLVQTLENVLMCLGVMPVIGLTLPLFSYGGTSVVTMFIALGIVSGIRMREKPSWLM